MITYKEDYMNRMRDRFEQLKQKIFNSGIEAIDDFLGFEVDSNWEKDTIESAMDEVYQQMPAEELEAYFVKYGI